MKSSVRGIPFFYLPAVFLFSAGTGIAVFSWAHLLSTVFGMHAFSRVTIWMIFFLWLAVGSIFHGRWADKLKNPMVLALILPLAAGLFTLAHPVWWYLLNHSFAWLNAAVQPAPFTMGFIRLLLCGVFLLVPLTSAGGLLPVTARIFTRSVIMAGSRWSAVVTDASLGLIAGLATAILYTIPVFGYGTTLIVAASLILISAVIPLVFQLRTTHLIPSIALPDLTFRPQRVTMLFRKRKPVLEAGIKLSRAMLRVLMIQGFVVAALVLSASRLLNDYTSVSDACRSLVLIAVFLGAFALGSFMYRTYAPKIANGYLMLASLEILSGFSLLFSMVLFPIAAPVMQQAATTSTSLGRILVFEALAAASLVFLPAFISGMILPLSARSYSRRLQHLGRSLGRLAAAFWLGILFSVAAVHFVLFPLMGSRNSLLFLMGAALFSGIYIVFRDSRLIRGFRISYTALSLLLFSGILTGIVKIGWIRRSTDTIERQIIDSEEGSSVIARVIHDKGNSMSLVINGIPLPGNAGNDIPVQEIPPLLACVATGKPVTALVLGFGTGITASTLEKCQVRSIHIAETSPELLTLASDAFSDENNDILTSSRTGISIEDGRLHLARFQGHYDLITSGFPAFQLLPGYHTSEFYREAFTKLTENGVLVQTLTLRTLDRESFFSVIAACAATFPQVSLWYLNRDHLLLLAAKKRMPPLCKLMDQFFIELHPTLQAWEASYSLPGRLIMADAELRKLTDGMPENTDNRPVAAFCRHRDVLNNSIAGELAGYFIPGKDVIKSMGCTRLRESQIDVMHNKYREELMRVQSPADPAP